MTQPIAFRNDIPFIKDLGVEFISAENARLIAVAKRYFGGGFCVAASKP
jgi:hypothetical protein